MTKTRNKKNSPTKEEREKQSQRDKAKNRMAVATRRTIDKTGNRVPMIVNTVRKNVPSLTAGFVGAEAESTVVQHLLLDKGAVLPRAIPTYVQPHLFRVKKNFRSFFPELAQDAPLPTVISVIVRPDVEKFLSIGAHQGDLESRTDWDTTHTTEVDYIWSSQVDVKYCFDENIHLQNGSKLVASTTPKEGFRFFKSDKVADGLKWYPGVLVASSPVQLRAYIYNPDQQPMTVVPGLAILKGDPASPTVTSTDFEARDIASHITDIVQFATTTNDPISVAQWNAYFEGAIGFAFYYKIVNAVTIGRVPSGLSIQMFEVGPVDQHLVHLGGIRWRDRSLFEVLDDNGTLYNQFRKADSFSVTGVTAWLENVTAKLYRGGSLAAAQLAGGSEANLPTTMTQLESFIRKQTQRVLQSNDLSTGLFWTYIPEKVQDIFFEPTKGEYGPVRNVSQKPYLAGVLNLPLSSQASPEFVLDMRMMIEYITQEIDAPRVLAPNNCNNWLEKYFGELSKHNCVTENPEHWKHIKSVAKSVINSPLLRQAARDLTLYGIKQIPIMAMSFL